MPRYVCELASQTTKLAVGTPGRGHTQLVADRKRRAMPIGSEPEGRRLTPYWPGRTRAWVAS